MSRLNKSSKAGTPKVSRNKPPMYDSPPIETLSTLQSRRSGKGKVQGRKPQAHEPVCCKICNEWPSRYDHIRDHVASCHPDDYDPDQPRYYWIIQPSDRTVTKGCLNTKLDYESSSSGYVLDETDTKRQKVEENEASEPENSFQDLMTGVLGADSNAQSQDSFMLYDSLQKLVPTMNTASAALYFQTADARMEKSMIRQLVESGLNYISNDTEDNMASVLFAAITLAGTTLTIFKDSLKELEQTVREKVERKLRDLLLRLRGFDKRYADWLSKNLHRLKPNSIKLIEDEGPGSKDYLRWSLVTDFNY